MFSLPRFSALNNCLFFRSLLCRHHSRKALSLLPKLHHLKFTSPVCDGDGAGPVRLQNVRSGDFQPLQQFRMGMSIAVIPAAGNHGKHRIQSLQKRRRRGIPGAVMSRLQHCNISDILCLQRFLKCFLPFLLHISCQKQCPAAGGSTVKFHQNTFRTCVDILRGKARAGVQTDKIRTFTAPAVPGGQIPHRNSSSFLRSSSRFRQGPQLLFPQTLIHGRQQQLMYCDIIFSANGKQFQSAVYMVHVRMRQKNRINVPNPAVFQTGKQYISPHIASTAASAVKEVILSGSGMYQDAVPLSHIQENHAVLRPWLHGKKQHCKAQDSGACRTVHISFPGLQAGSEYHDT